jgi:protein-L-isoaspartate O-methyltransferase
MTGIADLATAPADNDHQRHHHRLIGRLVTAGVLSDPAWLEAFARTPRDQFLDQIWRPVGPDRWELVGPGHPDWLRMAFADTTCVTDLVDPRGAPTGSPAVPGEPVAGMPGCAVPAPSLAAAILHAADIAPTHQVLQIGTGSGWTAALLCHRIHDLRVITVEHDPQRARQAGTRLAGLGLRPRLIVADAIHRYHWQVDAGGDYPQSLRFNRVVSTVAVHSIPTSWLTHTAPGGVIVTPLRGNALGGPLIHLTVTEPGAALGRFLPDTAALPDQYRLYDDPALLDAALNSASPFPDTDTIDPADLHHSGLQMFFSLFTTHVFATTPGFWWLLHPDSTARIDVTTGDVAHRGDAYLWQYLRGLYQMWCQWERPTRRRFGITITPCPHMPNKPATHRVWLDQPTNIILL